VTPSSPAPALSVIIPVRNGARYLGAAVTSVLRQGEADLEVIVLVDEASTDNSAEVAESFASPSPAAAGTALVRCVRHPPLSLAAARNEGVALARGSILLHLDADDELTPGSLAVRLAVLATQPDVEMVTGTMVSFVSPEIPPAEAARYAVPVGPQRGGLPGTTLLRTCCAHRIGPQNAHLPHSADLDWMLRAGEAAAKVVHLPDVVLRRRIHGRNTSLLATGAASRLGIIRAALARRAHPGESQSA
jgi:glycosyltransferase involved in cell wall biosynthesis